MHYFVFWPSIYIYLTEKENFLSANIPISGVETSKDIEFYIQEFHVPFVLAKTFSLLLQQFAKSRNRVVT